MFNSYADIEIKLHLFFPKFSIILFFAVCYKELYEWSCQNYSEFWEELWQFCDIKYSQSYEEVSWMNSTVLAPVFYDDMNLIGAHVQN